MVWVECALAPNSSTLEWRTKMSLPEIVRKYCRLAGSFGPPVALDTFGLSRQETEATFGGFDEDYHISRFFHFSLDNALRDAPDRTYRINGFPQSHVSIEGGIEEIL